VRPGADQRGHRRAGPHGLTGAGPTRPAPPLAECDPLTGQRIRATRHTTCRYDHPAAGDLVHLDVKKIGKIPPGGGWRAHGRGPKPGSVRGLGYDYVHAAVDDHSRLAYAEILDDERGPACAGFLLRAAAWFADHGISRVHRVLTGNAKNYAISRDFAAAVTVLGESGRGGRLTVPCGRAAEQQQDPLPTGGRQGVARGLSCRVGGPARACSGWKAFVGTRMRRRAALLGSRLG
jgi:hypothetical protein